MYVLFCVREILGLSPRTHQVEYYMVLPPGLVTLIHHPEMNCCHSWVINFTYIFMLKFSCTHE